MTTLPMLSNARRNQKHIAKWAQVIPAKISENLRITCEFCNENSYDWIINGRTAGLTGTGCITCCNNCLYLALSSVRWH
jgi:hypothetical protein